MLRYVKSPSGKVHIAYGDKTCCRKKITPEWNDDDENLRYRSHRLWNAEWWKDVEICLECDKERDDLFHQFSPFVNSTHLTSRAADKGYGVQKWIGNKPASQ